MHLSVLIVLVSCVLITTEHTTVTPTTDENVDQSEATTTKPLIVRSTDKEKGLPKETQMAQCTVTSGDIKASAQATFSKKLEGFCSTNDMVDLREMLTKIESRLNNEIFALRSMVRSLLPRDYYNEPSYNTQRYNSEYDDRRSNNYDQSFNRHQEPPRETYYQNNVNRHEPQRQETYHQFVATTTRRPETTTSEFIFTSPAARQPEVVNVMKNKLKSLETGRGKSFKNISTSTIAPVTSTQPPPTEAPEIPTKNEYTYYWKLENFPKVFIYAKKNEVFSHVFNVKGLFLRIRAAMNDIDDENLSLDIEHLANIDSEKMEIEISDGLVFQEIAEEKLFQYSFAIMDQTRPNHDLISPIYWNTDTDNFLVPNSVHLLANYVKNESLLIKLVISF